MNIKASNKLTMSKGLVQYLKVGSKPGKIPELDGLRALAILMVLFHHYTTFYRENHGSYFKELFPEVVNNFLFNGWLGVDLFFVLSGYLIFHHLVQVQDQPNKIQTYGRYALKRILRTFPLYYAIILLITFGLIPYYRSNLEFSDYLIHLFFLQDYLGANILVPLWSLATEEKFYLLAPFLLLLIKRLSPMKSIIFLMIFIMLMVAWKSMLMGQTDQALNHPLFFVHYRAPFHFAVGSILVGVMVALMVQLQPPRKLQVFALIATVLIIAIIFLNNLYHPKNWSWLNLWHVIVVLLFGVLVWASVKNTGVKSMRILCGRTLRVVSVLSYSLYLAHYTVLPWVYRLHRQYIYSEEAWVHAGSFLLIYLGIVFVFSLLLHYLVEKPFLIIKDRL